MPPEPAYPKQLSSRIRSGIIALFLFLLLCAAFVLLANPVAISVTPAPDNLSVSGFPPVVKVGDHYMGISGDYTLRADKAGFRKLEQEIIIDSSGRSYQLVLEALPGLLSVSSTPAGATLLVDGVARGVTPLAAVEVAAGTRQLRFEHPRYLPLEQMLEVEGFGASRKGRACCLMG